MNKQYTVFSCHHHKLAVTAKMDDGTEVPARMDSVDVQLSPDDGRGGTVHVTFTGPSAISEAEAMFTDGAKVNVTFESAGE